MGNTACCQGQTGDSSAGEITEAANKPQKKAMEGFAAELEAGMTIKGVGLKEAILVQAALRGYVARKAFLKGRFVPNRDDIIDLDVEHIPDFSNDYTREARSKLGGGDYIVPDTESEHPLYMFNAVQFKDGAVYAGEWTRESLREGRGVLYKTDGEVYEGQWRDDMPNGKGRLILPTGHVYIGEFNNGHLGGQGKYTTLEGYTYTGEWFNDAKHGQGSEVYSDASVYEGDYVNGEKSGYGVFKWPDGRQYEGNWAGDHKDGYGTLSFADGKKHAGQWSKDKLHGRGKVIEGGSEREAEWNHGRRTRWITSS